MTLALGIGRVIVTVDVCDSQFGAKTAVHGCELYSCLDCIWWKITIPWDKEFRFMAISGRYLAYVRSMYDVRVEEETNNIMFFFWYSSSISSIGSLEIHWVHVGSLFPPESFRLFSSSSLGPSGPWVRAPARAFVSRCRMLLMRRDNGWLQCSRIIHNYYYVYYIMKSNKSIWLNIIKQGI